MHDIQTFNRYKQPAHAGALLYLPFLLSRLVAQLYIWQQLSFPARTMSHSEGFGGSRFDAPLTYDEALTKQIGQFGPGQWQAVLWASMFSIANAAAFFFWTFATVDPVSDHGWSCASAADAACAAVWQQSTPNRQSFCSLAADQWHWTSQGKACAACNSVAVFLTSLLLQLCCCSASAQCDVVHEAARWRQLSAGGQQHTSAWCGWVMLCKLTRSREHRLCCCFL